MKRRTVTLELDDDWQAALDALVHQTGATPEQIASAALKRYITDLNRPR